jgi:outer membrane protein assembly factor BamB
MGPVHISVYCPTCRERFQLQPELLGRIIRCPNPTCRGLFEVREAPEADGEAGPDPGRPTEGVPREGGPRYTSGSVTELIPLLPAEPIRAPSVAPPGQAPPPRRAPAAPAPAWEESPPPARKPGAAPAVRPDLPPPSPVTAPPPVREKPKDPAPKAGPVEVMLDAGEAPPVRQPRKPSPPAAGAPAPAAVPAGRRRARLMILAAVLSVGATLAGVALVVWTALARDEAGRYHTALEQFHGKQFGKAEKSFTILAQDFPDSERRGEYQFMEGLARALQPAYEPGQDVGQALEELSAFVQSHAGAPGLQSERPAVRTAFEHLAAGLTEEAQQALRGDRDLARARRRLGEARQARARAREFGADFVPREEEELAAVEKGIESTKLRQEVLAELQRLKPTADDIRKGQALLAQRGLSADSEAGAILDRLREDFLAQVRYVPSPDDGSPLPPDPSSPRGLVVTPMVTGASPTPTGKAELAYPKSALAASGAGGPARDGVVFALARGVLYALAPVDGRFLWAAFVGLDVVTLPIRVPETGPAQEKVLVLSSTPPALTARRLQDGRELWRQSLSAPCLCRPVLVGRQAFLPTLDGRVHVVDVGSGRRLGWYETGLPLTVAAALEEGADRLYVAADSLCVFVLDVKEQKCVGVLPTGHPAGSLRAAPVLVRANGVPTGTAGDARPSHLILTQTDGLAGMKLRAFPLRNASTQTAGGPEAELAVAGWSWFEPVCDVEKIALATDAGVFTLLGINQPRNQDSPLFALVPQALALGPPNGEPVARAVVVHSEDSDFWVLVDGRLRAVRLTLDREKGLRLAERWTENLALGAPLQPGQASRSGDRLFLVTQSADGHACLATAVEAVTGRVLWQRQIGAVFRGDLVEVNDEVVALDGRGAVYAFRLAEAAEVDKEWQTGGRIVAPAPVGGGTGFSCLLAAPDGRAVYALRSPDPEERLEVCRYAGGEVDTRSLPLRNPVRGTPAVGPDYLLLPLADGSLSRQPLDGKPSRQIAWRDARAAHDSAGHVVYLAPDQFLTTDGGRGLTRWRWPEGESAREEKRVELSGRIVAAPAVLPAAERGEPMVVVAHEGGVELLRVSDLDRQRSWNLKGLVTAGPYVAGGSIGCVVEKNRLVWFDPAREEPRWEYSGPQDIIGRPPLVHGWVLAADLSGQVAALDPATGARDTARTVPTSASPATAPVAFGADRVFLTLDNGTVVLYQLEQVRSAKPSTEAVP